MLFSGLEGEGAPLTDSVVQMGLGVTGRRRRGPPAHRGGGAHGGGAGGATQRMEKIANRDVRVSGGGSLTGPSRDARRISLYTMVALTGGYAYTVGVWDLSIVQGPFSVAPCQTLALRFATFFIGVGRKGAPEL